MRILDALDIEYTMHRYEWDEDYLDAIHAAASAGLDPEIVYKTIVMKNSDNLLFVFCLPAQFEISRKKAKEITGSRDIELLKTSELKNATGYIRGGCSPLGMKHKLPTFIEELALLEERICVSAGERGMFLELRPEDLRRAAEAEFAGFTI